MSFRMLLRVAMAGLIILLTGHSLSALAAPLKVTSPRLYVLDCGTILDTIPEKYQIERRQVISTTMTDLCFFIVHPKGTLLWETGISDSFAGQGPVVVGDEGIKFLKTNTVIGQLAEIGYSPEQVDFLSQSHYHLDHTGNSNAFAGSARWLVSKDEWNAMFNAKEPPLGSENFSKLKSAKTTFIADNYDVFGDGTAIIRRAVGHTPGHSVLQLTLKKTGPIILAGDLWHYPEELMLNLMPKAEETQGTPQARMMVAELARRLKAPIWTNHDRELFKLVARVPAFYE